MLWKAIYAFVNFDINVLKNTNELTTIKSGHVTSRQELKLIKTWNI